MKEVMLCVILIVAGALAQTPGPDGVITDAMLVQPTGETTDKTTTVPGEESNVEAAGMRQRWCYTQWFDRDNPSGYGDYETFAHLRDENPRLICRYPYFIQAQTLGGVNAYATGQVFESYDTTTGFVCVNEQQSLFQRCLDYKVRFACPCLWENS